MMKEIKISDVYYCSIDEQYINETFFDQDKNETKITKQPKVALIIENSTYCVVVPQYVYRDLREQILNAKYHFPFKTDANQQRSYLKFNGMLFVPLSKIKKSVLQDNAKIDTIRSNLEKIKTIISTVIAFSKTDKTNDSKRITKTLTKCQTQFSNKSIEQKSAEVSDTEVKEAEDKLVNDETKTENKVDKTEEVKVIEKIADAPETPKQPEKVINVAEVKIKDAYYCRVNENYIDAIFFEQEKVNSRILNQAKIALTIDNSKYCVVIPQYVYNDAREQAVNAKFQFLFSNANSKGQKGYLKFKEMFFVPIKQVKRIEQQNLVNVDELRSNFDNLTTTIDETLAFAKTDKSISSLRIGKTFLLYKNKQNVKTTPGRSLFFKYLIYALPVCTVASLLWFYIKWFAFR